MLINELCILLHLLLFVFVFCPIALLYFVAVQIDFPGICLICIFNAQVSLENWQSQMDLLIKVKVNQGCKTKMNVKIVICGNRDSLIDLFKWLFFYFQTFDYYKIVQVKVVLTSKK